MKGIIENPDTGERFFDLKKILDSKPSCDDNGFVSGCKECCNPKIEHKELQLCASCNKARRKRETLASKPKKPIYRIPKMGKKRKEESKTYSDRRLIFLEGKKCAVFPELDATEVHHQKGREGYADNWARDKKISLYLDERYWLPVSHDGHVYIGDHPQTAFDNGWSLSRLENLDQEPITI